MRKHAEFEALQRVMIEALRRDPIRIHSYCILSNHWHFVVWPETDGQVSNKALVHGPGVTVVEQRRSAAALDPL